MNGWLNQRRKKKPQQPVATEAPTSGEPREYTLVYAVHFRCDALVTVKARSPQEAARIGSLDVRAALDVAALHPVLAKGDNQTVQITNGLAVLTDAEQPTLVSYK